jgi:hypothetical protein
VSARYRFVGGVKPRVSSCNRRLLLAWSVFDELQGVELVLQNTRLCLYVLIIYGIGVPWTEMLKLSVGGPLVRCWVTKGTVKVFGRYKVYNYVLKTVH